MSFSMGQPGQSGLDLLFESLGAGASQGIGKSLENFYQQRETEKKVSQLAPALQELFKQSGTDLPLESIQNLVNQGGNLQTLAPYAQMFSKQREAQELKEAQQKALEEKEASKIRAEERAQLTKERQKVSEQQQETQGLQNSLKWLKDNIKYTGTTKIPTTTSATYGGLNRNVIQKRSEFDTTGFLVADQIFTHFNKGTVSESKLEQIKENLAPKAKLPERINIGRINSLERIMGLSPNTSKENFDKVADEEIKKNQSKYSKEEKIEMLAPNGEKVPMNPDLVDEAIQRGWKIL